MQQIKARRPKKRPLLVLYYEIEKKELNKQLFTDIKEPLKKTSCCCRRQRADAAVSLGSSTWSVWLYSSWLVGAACYTKSWQLASPKAENDLE